MSNDADRFDVETGDSDLRRRAAWLLAMLVVVAGLVVLLMSVFLNSAGKGTGQGSGPGIDDPTSSGTSQSAARPHPSASSTAPGSTTASGPAGSGVPTAATSSVPPASCPGSVTCTVAGDVGGAQNAINAYREKNGKKPLPTSTSAAAESCARSSGSDCSGSYVWVHVSDLSGQSVVDGVLGFSSSGDVLDDSATSFSVGWAYDPASHATYCALIANS